MDNGEILNYPYSFDQDHNHEVVFQEKLYKAQRDESVKLQDEREKLLNPAATVTIKNFPKAAEFAESLCDMCVIEGQLDAHRKDLATRSDFNTFDAYKLFSHCQVGKAGIDCDDLDLALRENL